MQRETKKGPDLFQKCLAASFALHVGLLIGGRLARHSAAPPLLEIDLSMTSGINGTGPAKLGAPKKLVPDAKGLPKPAEDNTPPKPVPVTPPPKDWVTPGPNTKVVENLPEPAPTPGGAPEGTGTAAKLGGSGVGSDEGCPGCTGNGRAALSKLPVLLNKNELLAIMRRFYPESERRAGREGKVIVFLHISVEGKVDPVDIGQSGGAAFDAGAKEVAKRMRFSPALGLKGEPVPVKMPQAILFQLED
ncbi:MAG: energy transducer TonB [Elusimicrobia bacterium]|nr:energy transducer TonB [Elusimicrobiota bacterium]